MRWIIASRESPAFPMGSWIARGWMGLPITGDDLSFTPEEAAELAASLNVEVTSELVSTIIDETLGWPIGVRLALSLVARKRGIGSTRVQTREALFALLDDEVWKPLSAPLRALIAAAALLPAPAFAPLEATGLANVRANMEQIFAKVPFIAAIDDEAFAIHDLFREFVGTKAARESSSGGIATRMGAALVASGNPADGLRLLVDANDVAGVSDALALHAFDLLETGQRSAVNTALAFLGEHNLDDSGVALAVRGALAFADGSPTNSANLFVRALERDAPPAIRGAVSQRLALNYANRGLLTEALEALAPVENDPSISAEARLEIRALSTMLVSVAGLGDHAQTNALIAELEGQLATAQPSVQARLLQRLGNAAFYNWDAEAAERLSQDAAQMAIQLGMDTVAALAYGTLYSMAVFFDADPGRARSFARSLAAAAERAANTGLHVYALRVQYMIAAMDVEVDEANALESALASLVDARTYREIFPFRFAKALQYVAMNDVAKAEATLRSMPGTTMSGPERARRENFLTLLLLLRGKRGVAAATALERGFLSEAPNDAQGRVAMANAFALRGIAFWALDRPAMARKAFELDAGEMPLRERILLDAFKELASMPHPLPSGEAIDRLRSRLTKAGYRAYAELLRMLVDVDANDVELSASELETLREFDRGGRAADVAKALGKSRYTVQNQIQSAIKKLGCSGRAEALAYARQRGWLDRTPS